MIAFHPWSRLIGLFRLAKLPSHCLAAIKEAEADRICYEPQQLDFDYYLRTL